MPERSHHVRTTIRILRHPDGKRRVLIVDRGGGRYGYEEEYFSDEPLEMAWLSLPQRPLTICDSPELPEREARGAVAWLVDVNSN